MSAILATTTVTPMDFVSITSVVSCASVTLATLEKGQSALAKILMSVPWRQTTVVSMLSVTTQEAVSSALATTDMMVMECLATALMAM